MFSLCFVRLPGFLVYFLASLSLRYCVCVHCSTFLVPVWSFLFACLVVCTCILLFSSCLCLWLWFSPLPQCRMLWCYFASFTLAHLRLLDFAFLESSTPLRLPVRHSFILCSSCSVYFSFDSVALLQVAYFFVRFLYIFLMVRHNTYLYWSAFRIFFVPRNSLKGNGFVDESNQELCFCAPITHNFSKFILNSLEIFFQNFSKCFLHLTLANMNVVS